MFIYSVYFTTVKTGAIAWHVLLLFFFKYNCKSSLFAKILYKNLFTVLLEDKLYLNPSLTLTELALAAGTNRSYASQAINKTYHDNFNTLVNSYRVETAKNILKEAPDLKLETVAEQSGFGSAQSMHRNFSKQTGISPGKVKQTFRKHKDVKA